MAPKVSVCVVTYNQETYIGQCLQSLVEQETSFPFEVIVGDDGSSDGTRDSIMEFARKHSGLVVPLFQQKNLGPVGNYLSTHAAARGTYIAHMDGDDYALPGKLQTQADFLDNHPECALVFHKCLLLNTDGSTSYIQHPAEMKGLHDIARFFHNHPSRCLHSSKMYRRSAGIGHEVQRDPLIDNHLHFLHGLSGKLGFMDEALGVYRVGVGMSNNVQRLHESKIDSYHYAMTLGHDARLMRQLIAREYFEHGLRCLENGDRQRFSHYVALGYRHGHRNCRALWARALSGFPGVYVWTRHQARHLRSLLRGSSR